MLDFRAVFDELDISWRDRGKNCGRGQIVISCPFCGDDPSEHLSISEAKEAYYCFRDPSKHSGNNLVRLFVACGVKYHEVPELLNRHNSEVPAPEPIKKPSASLSEARWQAFEPAADNPECVEYLRGRGFLSPAATCRQYQLRFTRTGKWARRLLIPVHEDGHVITWIGRAMTASISPKYVANPIDHPGYVYVPRAARDTLVIVEGSLDALKVAVATDAYAFSSLALLGKGLNATKLLRIAELAKRCKRILVAMDDDVIDPYAIINDVRSKLQCPVERLPMLDGVKDPGEMSTEKIHAWLAT